MPLMRRRRSGPGAAPLFAAGLAAAAALTACASTQQPNTPQSVGTTDSNIPAAPNVDRSKCSDKGKQVITVDTNQDKKPDVWKFFAQGGQGAQVLACKQRDLNNDGKIDMVQYYDDQGAQVILDEADLDFDGKFDMTTYYVSGKKVREELTMNFSGRPDTWKYYEDEKLVRVERDTNNDGKVDEWQYYEGGKLDRIGYDTTGSGRVDRWDRAPEADDNEPGGGAGGAVPAGASAPAPTAPPPAPGAAKPAPAATTAAKK